MKMKKNKKRKRVKKPYLVTREYFNPDMIRSHGPSGDVRVVSKHATLEEARKAKKKAEKDWPYYIIRIEVI
jgi:hypothetical protein